MEALWINTFCTTTIEVFRTMFSIEAKPGTPRLKGEPYTSADITGIIGFSGEAQGSIALSFPSDTALKMISTLVGAPMNNLDMEVADGIGELANIVAGNAKKEIQGIALSISLPQVVIGKNHVLSVQSAIPVVIIPFSTPMGDFVVEFSLKKK
jgi:chemotaxis protein CheX